MKKETNPSQTWRRIKDRANTFINDLILLGEKLPDEKQGEIFNDKKIFALMRSIVWNHNFDDPETEFEKRIEGMFDGRRTTLASTLVTVGIIVCIEQYRLLMKDTPDLAEPIMSQLRQSANICRDIAYRSELMERDIEAEKQEIDYLFKWNEVTTTRYTRRFAEFIRNEVKFVAIELGPVKLRKYGKNISGTFKEIGDEQEPSWSFIFELNDDKTNASFKAFDENGSEQARKNLIIKYIDHDNIFVYAKKNN